MGKPGITASQHQDFPQTQSQNAMDQIQMEWKDVKAQYDPREHMANTQHTITVIIFGQCLGQIKCWRANIIIHVIRQQRGQILSNFDNLNSWFWTTYLRTNLKIQSETTGSGCVNHQERNNKADFRPGQCISVGDFNNGDCISCCVISNRLRAINSLNNEMFVMTEGYLEIKKLHCSFGTNTVPSSTFKKVKFSPGVSCV